MSFKNIIIKSVSYGFASGFCVGCLPNSLYIKYEDRKYKSIPIPLISGLICSLSLFFSPLLIMNYCSNGVYFDKLIDRYNINIERYHQYDNKNNKYAFPSSIILNIKSKKGDN